MTPTRALSYLLLLTLAACGETVPLQGDYTEARDACQNFSEKKVAKIESYDGTQYNAKERNTLLVENFNHCMADKNWDLGKPKDAPVPAGTAPPKTELVNRGIGVGVGPAYALEEQPRTRTNRGVPSSVAGERLAAPSNVKPAPVILREPKADIDLRGRELPRVEGEVPRVRGEIPKPTPSVTRPTGARAPARTESVASESAAETRGAVAPADAPVLREGPAPDRPSLPNNAGALSTDTLDELKRAIEQ